MDVIYTCEVDIEDALFKISFDEVFYSSPSKPVLLHNHNAYEVHIIEHGEFIFDINSMQVTVSDGDCCVIKPNTYHSKGNTKSDNARKYCFKFEYFTNTNNSFDKSRKTNKFDFLRMSEDVFVSGNCSKSINILKDIKSEMDDLYIGYQTNLKNLSSLLLIDILRGMCCKKISDNNYRHSNLEDSRHAVIDSFFAINYMNDVYATDLADLLNISIRQLSRIMYKYYGLTFKDKLAQIRIFAAKDLLKDKKMTISRIAEAVGYNNTKYFTDAFKKATGETPLQYRNNFT